MVIFDKKVAGLSEGALARFVLRAKREAKLRGKVNVLVTKNATLRSLNWRFRGQNKPTDVLSFPAPAAAGRSGRTGGEIAISADLAVQSAVRLGHSAAEEIRILVLHGVLHLAGYDHERDNGLMARKESQLRRVLRLPDGLIERAQVAGKIRRRVAALATARSMR